MKCRTKIILWSLAFFGPIWWVYPIGLLGGKVTLSPETTRITSPLKENGVPDYAAWHNAHDGAGVTAENNAAVLLAAGWRGREEIWRQLGVAPQPVTGATYQWFEEWAEASKTALQEPVLREAPEGDLTKIACEVEGQGYWPWTSKEHPDLAAWLRSQQPFIGRIREASRRERFFVPYREGEQLFSQLAPWLGEAKRDANLLRIHAMQCLGEGRVEEAMEDVWAIRRLGKLVATSGSSLMPGLVGFNIEGVADEAAFQIALAVPKNHPARGEVVRMAADPVSDFEGMLARTLREGERDQVLEVAQEFFRDERFVARASPSVGLALRTVQDQVDMDRALRHIQASFEATIRHENPLSGSPNFGQAVASVMLLPPGFRAARLSDGLAGTMEEILMPVLGSLHKNGMRRKKAHAFLAVAVALADYRADHQGVFPVKLEALVPNYLSSVPKQEIEGESWVYETADSGKAFGIVCVKEDKKALYARNPRIGLVMAGSPNFEKIRDKESEEK